MELGARIRARRRQLGLTLKEVAGSSGLSVPYLSQVERQQANPTVTALAAIAQALGVTLSFFVPEDPHPDVVVRRGEAPALRLRELPYGVRRLAGLDAGRQLEPLLISLAPRFDSPPRSHMGEEFLYVLSGELRLRVGERQFELRPGDSAQHPSTEPHAWANPGEAETVLLWVGTPRFV